MNRRKRSRIAVILVSVIIAAEVGGCTDTKENLQQSYKIGVICWEGSNMLSEALRSYISYLEDSFPVEMELVTPAMGFLNYEEIAEYLCKEEMDAIMNVTTESLPEILSVCEEYEVYLFQFWDMPSDTDQMVRYEESPYFLGYIKNDERATAKEMARQMIEAGCEKIAILETYYCGQSSQVHRIRCDELLQYLEERKTGAVKKIVRTTDRKEAIKNLADQAYELDGMIFTAYHHEISLENIKSLFENPDMKFVYFDVNEQTRNDLEDGDLIMVSCGQHNVFGLSFAYLYHFLNSHREKENMIALECDYLRITSVSEYDEYMEYCIDEMPYNAQTIQKISDSLNDGLEMLERYCKEYSLESIRRQKQI